MKQQTPIETQTIRNFIRPLRHLPLLIGLVLCARLAAQPAPPAPAGSLQGRISFAGGTIPQGTNLADTVVYLIGDGLTAHREPARPGARAVLDQRDITYVPHVLPVLAGTKVEIRNSDAILHTVHTNSQKNPAFDRPELGNQSVEVTFAAPEIIPVSCDVHSQMSAYIVVVPTPYFTKAAKDGSFKLTDLPPGKYRLVAWHEKYNAIELTVEINAGNNAPVEVKMPTTSTLAKS